MIKINERLDLIKGYAISSLERIAKIREVRMLYNNLDNVTQQNAASASEANKVAREVNEIAEKVVEHTNEKEFEGK